MARPAKKGIDFFPFDVDFLNNIKVRRILRHCGPNSISILIYLLSNIYKDEGYYMKWNDDISFLITDSLGVSEEEINAVIEKSLEVGFFNEKMFEKYKIITSKGIQDRYLFATEKRVKTHVIDEYILVSDTETRVSDTETTEKQSISTQSKVKESKVNKSKEKESKKNTQKTDVISEYTSNENLRKTILAFKDMRKTIKKPLTDHALKLLLNKLDKLEDSDSGKIAVLEQSIMNSWQGVFELKGQAKQEVVREMERKEGVQVGVIQKI